MSTHPLVSVVVGVRNGATTIASTISSLKQQDEVDLEIVVVDDGSTDDTFSILQKLAVTDPRLKVIGQKPSGLTKALIRGCNAAMGEFIARQDDGDLSLPTRLAQQAACLHENQSAALCSSYVRFVVPEGATTEVRSPTTDDLADGLTGPACHGSVMMRRSIYRQVGGYRAAFYYAQDIDLWSRMVEHGSHIVVPKVLYQSVVSPKSISGSHRYEQMLFHQFIVGATEARRAGHSEDAWIKRAEKLTALCIRSKPSVQREADGAYFIGSCLIRENPDLAYNYFKRTIELNPRHLKARLRLVLRK